MARKKAMIARREPGYNAVLAEVLHLVEEARRASARSVNAVMTSAYWQIGRRIVEHKQGGATRAGYGEALLVMLAADLTERFKRGFSVDRLETARLFYLAYPGVGIPGKIRDAVAEIATRGRNPALAALLVTLHAIG